MAHRRLLGTILVSVVAVALVAVLVMLPHLGAGFADSTGSTGNSFAADTLDPPTALTATCGTDPITLDWTATPDTYAAGHRVLRSSTPGGPYSQIAQVTPRTTVTYDDSPAAGTYYYVVRAYYLSWESLDGNEAEGSTTACPPLSVGAEADSDVDEFALSSNNGTSGTMVIKTASGSQRKRAFARFDVSSIPGGSTVDSATLTVCVSGFNTTRTVDLNRVTASWVETTITWANQPAVAASITDSTTISSAGCWTWTVTADVQLWVDGTANNGWRLVDSNESSTPPKTTEFRTRENATVAERPKLDVTYTP